MHKIIYSVLDYKSIDLIKPLWEELNEHHYARSKHFKNRYKYFTFEKRKSMFLEKINAGCILHIDTAKDNQTNKIIGYCICTAANKEAEIDSICIDSNYRGKGIGDKLISKSISWIKKNKIDSVKIVVASGNEEVFGFYAKYGFYPKYTTLEKPE